MGVESEEEKDEQNSLSWPHTSIMLGTMPIPDDFCFTHSIFRLGDLDETKKAGSLHEYLLQLHDHGRCPVTSFWWGEEQVVSVCSPQAFKDTVKLTDRAGEVRTE